MELDKKRIGLHIFRRDLRIEDNLNLAALSERVDIIIPVFIFTKKQIITNKLRNDNFVQFLTESLIDLDKRIGNNLVILNDFDRSEEQIENHVVIREIIQNFGVTDLSFMKDYTLYSRLRDKKIDEKIRAENDKIQITSLEDTMLYPITENIRTDAGKVYQKFTPYYNKVMAPDNFKPLVTRLKMSRGTKISEKIQSKIANFGEMLKSTDNDFGKDINNRRFDKFTDLLEKIQTKIDYSPITSEERKKGGRTEGLKILKEIMEKKFNKYETERDYPAKSQTTRLSAYLKLGTISIREAARIVLSTDNMPLFRELIWRDFYYYISFHFSHVLLPMSEQNLEGKRNFDKSTPRWRDSKNIDVQSDLEKWKTGQTGFPIVDAGMRQLNSIGWMHNRIRMVVASFLIKDLRINWQEGEIYFAQKLIDYDPSQNNGGWQWTNGSGVDSQPYNRIFNPWEQAKKWDPDAEYIKKWVPELSFYSADTIHNWDKYHSEIIKAKKDTKTYFAPMVDHAEARKLYLQSFD